MIRIAITRAAFEAIKATLPVGSIGFERDGADHVSGSNVVEKIEYKDGGV